MIKLLSEQRYPEADSAGMMGASRHWEARQSEDGAHLRGASLDGAIDKVEVDLAPGLPAFKFAGLPDDTAVTPGGRRSRTS